MTKIIEFVKANKTAFIVGGIILLAIILYFALRKGDDDANVTAPGCPGSFTLKPTGGVQSLISTAYSMLDGKYFKQISGGAFGATGSLPKKEIGKDEFLAACKEYQKPVTGDNPPSSGRQYQFGGIPLVANTGCGLK